MVSEGCLEEENSSVAVCVLGYFMWEMWPQRQVTRQAGASEVSGPSPRSAFYFDDKHLFSTYCVLGTVSHTGHTAVTRQLGNGILAVDREERRQRYTRSRGRAGTGIGGEPAGRSGSTAGRGAECGALP